ncbi:protein of unknown function [Candidatus Methylacidiphilum fumarolicum]|uniref:Uncharacterized protein n=1 Tax=Candidatus Methylacidiphilum fumarolicum TaxID=591154 RepID=A0ABM9IBT5_9BACT|nr:protein of unknown function [Candidatus Methylacidiphilum fumarolicum]
MRSENCTVTVKGQNAKVTLLNGETFNALALGSLSSGKEKRIELRKKECSKKEPARRGK